jgi:hypothetical protein
VSEITSGRLAATGTAPHPFAPWHPDWFKPRCKVCREFSDHELHRPDATEEPHDG